MTKYLEMLILKIIMKVFIGEIVEQHLYSENASGVVSGCIVPQYENIWRLNSDYVNVNIGYEAFNPIHTDLVISSYLGDVKNSIYVGKLQFICPIYNTRVSNTENLNINGLKGVKTNITFEEVTLKDINDDIRIILLNNKFPKCELNSNGELVIESLITTLGGNKTNYYLSNVSNISELQHTQNVKLINELELLKSTLSNTTSGAICNLTGAILTRLCNRL